MRTVLVGAVESSQKALECMHRHGFTPEALVTLPLAKASRHSDFVDLRQDARRTNTQLIETANINDKDTLAALAALSPDLIFVVGWSQICHRPFRSIPQHGCIGFHPSALPENRGRGVIPWTILKDLRRTAATFFWLGDGADDGDLLLQDAFSVDEQETARSLYTKHLDALERMLGKLLPSLARGEYSRFPQDHSLATYCARRRPRDGLIDWHRPAREIWRLIRAVTKPYPGAFTSLGEQKVVIWEADYVGEAPYWGLPGQIQAKGRKGVLVQCGDREHLHLRRWQLQPGEPSSHCEDFKIHDVLGAD